MRTKLLFLALTFFIFSKESNAIKTNLFEKQDIGKGYPMLHDTTIVVLDSHGDTLEINEYINDTISSITFFYSKNRLKKKIIYRNGLPYSIANNLSPAGVELYHGTFNMGSGSIIVYGKKGRVVLINYYQNQYLMESSFMDKRGRIRTWMEYEKNKPVFNMVLDRRGRKSFQIMYAENGIDVKKEIFFDKKGNIDFILPAEGNSNINPNK